MINSKKDSVWDSVSEISEKVNSGKQSAVELVKKAFDQIENNEPYHALLTDFKHSPIVDAALKRAEEIDQKTAKGQKAGRLAGVPFIAKDNFLTKNGFTTAASRILENFNAPYQATAINKLEAEGAIMVGKSNLDAFAHGSSTENSAFGPTLNPFDKTRVPGGSSGGSAAAVALNIAPFALGTDTGGSIRLPASFCGVVGYKPTYGLVSRYGVVAMASSTDVIGPMTRSVSETALILDVIAGVDEFDGTTIASDPEGYWKDIKISNKPKIGVIKEYLEAGVEKGVKDVILAGIAKLEKAGAEIVEVSLPSLELALACYYIIVPAEISSNLSRYDGQRYGLSAPDAKDLYESYELTRERGFEYENKRRIMIGTYVLSSGYYDAYYKKAQQTRTLLINEFSNIFNKVDYLAGPVSPTTAFKLGENSDPIKSYLRDIMTVAANLTGIPAISVPAGFSDGMPVGMQFMTPQKKDRKLLALAKLFEDLNK